MGDAAGERADRFHLLGLRHLGFERLLLGHLDGVDDRRLLRRLVALVDDRVHVEAEMAGLVAGVAGIDRRRYRPGGPWLRPAPRFSRSRSLSCTIAFKKRAALHVIIGDDAGEQA